MTAISPDGAIAHTSISALPLDAFATTTGVTPAAFQASWAVFGLKASTRGLGIFPMSILTGMAVALACTPAGAVRGKTGPVGATTWPGASRTGSAAAGSSHNDD